MLISLTTVTLTVVGCQRPIAENDLSPFAPATGSQPGSQKEKDPNERAAHNLNPATGGYDGNMVIKLRHDKERQHHKEPQSRNKSTSRSSDVIGS
ncbi:hypothetical protein WN944_007863 [Citrus x changshan-huyou]|uniref:Uncharacterized protein n=1 Tax=Citrus x changshan-huyou TaxID=2935761 RepID=A0AAP0MPH8_9ROSI